MSDPVTALNGASFDGLVSVAEMPPQGMITLRGALDDGAVKKAVKTGAGAAIPAPRQISQGQDRSVLWMSPDELMVLVPKDQVADVMQAMAGDLGKTHGLAVDVSDARAMFRLEGSACRAVLAKLSPADLRPASLPMGEVRRTRLAQVAAAFWLADQDVAYVICFRSVAGYVFDLLCTAADPAAETGAIPGF